MTNWKKRLEKGMKSLLKQIDLHKQKQQLAKEQKNEVLAAYYDKEIGLNKLDYEKKKWRRWKK